MSCTTPGAVIHYSIDGGEEQIYAKPFALTEGGLIRAYATADGLTDSPVSEERIGLYVNKSRWRIVSCSSQQGGAEAVANVIDEDGSTIWHSQYSPQKPTCPHEIVVDMSAYYSIAKFVYQGREDMGNGRVAKFEFYVSNSSTVWGAPVLTGTLQNNSAVQELELSTRPVGRYFRFLILSTHDNQGYASAAEIGVIPEAKESRQDAPTAAISTSATAVAYLRHKASGLFLHYLGGSSEGAFALGKLDGSDLSDQSYAFQFGKVKNYTAYFTLNTQEPKRFMTVDGWHVNGSQTQDASAHNQWILVEQIGGATIRLRGAEKEQKYFNFDHHTPGSFVYSDKATAAEFEVVKKSDLVAVNGLPAPKKGTTQAYDLGGRPVVLTSAATRKGLVIVDGVKTILD
jgi:beta-galactosidase